MDSASSSLSSSSHSSSSLSSSLLHSSSLSASSPNKPFLNTSGCAMLSSSLLSSSDESGSDIRRPSVSVMSIVIVKGNFQIKHAVSLRLWFSQSMPTSTGRRNSLLLDFDPHAFLCTLKTNFLAEISSSAASWGQNFVLRFAQMHTGG